MSPGWNVAYSLCHHTSIDWSLHLVPFCVPVSTGFWAAKAGLLQSVLTTAPASHGFSLTALLPLGTCLLPTRAVWVSDINRSIHSQCLGHENRRKVRPVPGSKGDHGLAAPRWSAQAKKRAKFELVKTSVGEKKGKKTEANELKRHKN